MSEAKNSRLRFDAVLDPAQRRAAIVRFLSSADLEFGARWLGTLLLECLRGERRARTTYGAMVPSAPVFAELGSAWLSEAYHFAEGGPFGALRLWLLIDGVAKEQDIYAETVLPVELESITLGRRRSLARRAKGLDLERLTSDNDALVIHHLLNNPRCTEAQALRIATKRPQASRLLEKVFEHPKFGRRPKVLNAVSLNPFTPLSLVYSILPLLGRQRVSEIARESAVREELRDAAKIFAWAIERDHYELNDEG